MNPSRWLCAALALLIAIAAPLASTVAVAQTPPPAPLAQMPPPPPPPAVLGAPIPTPPVEPTGGAKVGAGFLNVVYVPGKAILCGVGAAASTVLMLATFGSGYRAAVGLFNEGCGGRWVLTPYDVMGRDARPDDRAY